MSISEIIHLQTKMILLDESLVKYFFNSHQVEYI